MFCKSGILIFIFTKNNYLIYVHTLLIKTLLLHQSLGPCFFLSFFLFCLSICLSVSLSLSISGEFLGAQRPAELTFLPELLRPSGEGALSLHPLERAPGAYMQQRKP